MSDVEPTSVGHRSMRERMAAGDLYIADDPELADASSAARSTPDSRGSAGSRPT